ncbi:tyrosine kinase receptor Cad96Ca [Centruroides vittatus]|uniref:tyrosine kinase receptor Cad96Ca n=1 Tax=Centruroides vittatus TaxID=120091 RepID=UPI00350F20AC
MKCATLLLCIFVVKLKTGCCYPTHNTPPVFDFNRKWLIPENEPVGSRIITVRTNDDDNDPIEYSIEPALFLDGSNYFRIDKKTGDVYLQASLAGQAGNDCYLFVSANDGHQTAKIEVYVRILEANSRPPLVPTIDVPFITINRAPTGGGKGKSKGSHSFPTTESSLPAVVSTSLNTTTSPRATTKTTSKISATTTQSTRPSTPDTNNASDTPASTTETNNKRGFDMTSTVLPFLSILGFAPILGFVIWLFQKKCKKDEKLKPDEKIPERRDNDDSDELKINRHPCSLYLQRPKRAQSNRYESGEFYGPLTENRKWEFPRHHLRFIGILGEGCFGQVWKCEALNIYNKEGTSLVAVKTLKENATEKERKDLLSELEVMKLLNPHPNVVTLLGCCTERNPIFVIMEYVNHGKLQSYLRESRAERFYGNLHGSSKHLTSRDLTLFAYQVAKGMEYLASKGIIHRDLAARNILVDDNKICKVADFGFARDVIVTHVYERKSEGRLPIRWMAPESLFDNIFTSKTDVWSFGILMWEIVTLGSTPYPGLAAAEVMRRVREGYRLEKPEHCKREMYNIMFYCWDKDPAERPTFNELVLWLDKLLISENDYIELDRFPDHSYYNISNLSGEKL